MTHVSGLVPGQMEGARKRGESRVAGVPAPARSAWSRRGPERRELHAQLSSRPSPTAIWSTVSRNCSVLEEPRFGEGSRREASRAAGARMSFAATEETLTPARPRPRLVRSPYLNNWPEHGFLSHEQPALKSVNHFVTALGLLPRRRSSVEF